MWVFWLTEHHSGVETHHVSPPIKIWQIVQYSEVCCLCTLNYICTNSNLNLEHDRAGFTFTVSRDYIKPQSHYYNSYNSVLDFTPLMQFGLYSPTFITCAYKWAKNGSGFIIQWLTVAHLTCMWDRHLRTCKTGSCQETWQDSRLNSVTMRSALLEWILLIMLHALTMPSVSRWHLVHILFKCINI